MIAELFLCDISTDPTYKEWKLGVAVVAGGEGAGGTDPTYKEWKQQSHECEAHSPSCTDPTYKEWKLTGVSFGPTSFGARILPTRNGNP